MNMNCLFAVSLRQLLLWHREDELFLRLNRVNESVGDIDQNRLSYFPDRISNTIAPPEKFTFPFHYEPHPLAEYAAAELQRYLEAQTGLDHNFGLEPDKPDAAIGKMFGVLVVQDGGQTIDLAVPDDDAYAVNIASDGHGGSLLHLADNTRIDLSGIAHVTQTAFV